MTLAERLRIAEDIGRPFRSREAARIRADGAIARDRAIGGWLARRKAEGLPAVDNTGAITIRSDR